MKKMKADQDQLASDVREALAATTAQTEELRKALEQTLAANATADTAPTAVLIGAGATAAGDTPPDADGGAESQSPVGSGYRDMFSAGTPRKQQSEVGLLHLTLSERRHSAHVMALLDATDEKAPPRLAKTLHRLHPIMQKVLDLVDRLGPVFLAYWAKGMAIYRKMPRAVLYSLTALYGLSLCFCGGVFANTIAAAAAFKAGGYEKTRTCWHDIQEAATHIYETNRMDDLKDDNHDGVADVDQISSKMLLSRKITLIIRTVDPTVLQQAGVGIYQGFLGVLATLKFEFAKSIALGLSVGNMVKRPLSILLAPTLAHILKPDDCKTWSPMVRFVSLQSLPAISREVYWYDV